MSTHQSDKLGRYIITPQQILERFLITGDMGPSYKVNDRFATFALPIRESVKSIFEVYPQESLGTLRACIDLNKAPRRPPLILALAAALNNRDTRKGAEAIAEDFIRTGTDQFVLTDLLLSWGRGKGRSFKRAASTLYRKLDNEEGRDTLALNLVKYRSRAGWSHKDLLRTCHHTPSEGNNDLFGWVVGKRETDHKTIVGYERARHITSEKETLALLNEFDLPWEALTTESLAFKSVWEALLPGLGYTALIRNLGRLSSHGIPLGDYAAHIAQPHRSIHPVAALSAFKVYGQGKGEKGSLTWRPEQVIKDALNAAFDASFRGLRQSDAKVLFALDISGSMGSYASTVAGLNCREVSAAMMMAAMKQQPYMVYGFSHKLIPLDIQHGWNLDQTIRYLSSLPFGYTDAGLPIRFCTENKIHDVDMFAVYTDNETNRSGRPVDYLRQYRDASGRNSKLAVVAATGSAFSIADPSDPGMMDFVGLDASAPAAMLSLAES